MSELLEGPPAAGGLIGREQEIATLDAVLSGASAAHALLIDGGPGLGRSALIGHARSRATSFGRTALHCNSAESETRFPYAALHELLLPMADRLVELPDPQREALAWVLTLRGGPPPDEFLVGVATLSLLRHAAADQRVAVLVDDGQWLDSETARTLVFVMRRLRGPALVVLVALRRRRGDPFADLDAATLSLTPLGGQASRALLDRCAPQLSKPARTRVLTVANGCPLALVELPKAFVQSDGGSAQPSFEHPLTERLERSFTSGLTSLSEPARALALVAAVNDRTSSWEAMAAARRIDQAVSARSLSEAIDCGLVSEADGELDFTHGLVPLAIAQRAGGTMRRAAHAALADVIDEEDRSTWHRAEATSGADERLAARIEAFGLRARNRGAMAAAARSFERAAQLSETAVARTRRWLSAGELWLTAGRTFEVLRVGSIVEELPLSLRDCGKLTWLRASAEPTTPAEATTLMSLTATAEQLIGANERGIALDVLMTAMLNYASSDRAPIVKRALLQAVERLELATDDPRRLFALSYLAPEEHGQRVLELARAPRSSGRADVMALYAATHALHGLGPGALPVGLSSDAVQSARVTGRRRELAQLVAIRAVAAFHEGRWDLALADSVEGAALADDTEQPVYAGTALIVSGLLHAARGSFSVAAECLDQADRLAVVQDVSPLTLQLQRARALLAESMGRRQDAYDHLRVIFDRSAGSHDPRWQGLAIGELAEAAVAVGERDDARGLLERIAASDAQSLPGVHIAVAHARALLADDEEADACFERALLGDHQARQFQAARLQLAHGSSLRRRRRTSASREPLRAAARTFHRLGAGPWEERAQQELRASGESRILRTPEARDELTPQELHIARLAAAGLSNREIGERLFVSHRTVGSHLYRIYPKLGARSRQDLRKIDLGEPSLFGA